MVRIDKVEGVASLELWNDPVFRLKNIPFSAVHRLTEDFSQAAAPIVSEATERNQTGGDMKSPHLDQRVWVSTLKGTFVVRAVHPQQALADLESTDDTKTVEPQVPFGLIRPVGGGHNPTSSY